MVKTAVVVATICPTVYTEKRQRLSLLQHTRRRYGKFCLLFMELLCIGIGYIENFRKYWEKKFEELLRLPVVVAVVVVVYVVVVVGVILFVTVT